MANNSCSVVLTELGIAAFDEGARLVASKRFDDATRSYRLLKSGSIPDEVRQFIEKLRSFSLVTANDASVVAVLRQAGYISSLMPEDQQKFIQDSKPTYIVNSGFADNEAEALQALRDFAISLSSSKVKEASERLDLHIIQSINALDELDKIFRSHVSSPAAPGCIEHYLDLLVLHSRCLQYFRSYVLPEPGPADYFGVRD